MADATVEVDHDVCIVSGMCASLAPEIFDIDDGLRLEILQSTVSGELVAKARSAESCCPVEAITVDSTLRSPGDRKEVDERWH